MSDPVSSMDWLTRLATFGQSEPRQWLSLTLAWVMAVALAWATARLRLRWQLATCVLLAALGIFAAGHAEHALGTKDDRRILVDEVAAFPVATLGLPIRRHPWLLPGVLIASWVLDSTKPPPVAQSQMIPGGTGIVVDDVLANLYALVLGHLGWRVYRRRKRAREPGSS